MYKYFLERQVLGKVAQHITFEDINYIERYSRTYDVSFKYYFIPDITRIVISFEYKDDTLFFDEVFNKLADSHFSVITIKKVED